jgi:putative FmdB family regulatory protein
MPIYEYKCNKCGVFEAMQGIKEAPLKKCPTCKSKVERQMSRGSFILKGSGWYATDYAKKSAPSADSDSASTAERHGSVVRRLVLEAGNRIKAGNGIEIVVD